MHISAGRDLETQVARLHVHGVPHRGHEGRAAQSGAPAGQAADGAWPCCRRSQHRRCPVGAAPMAWQRSCARALSAAMPEACSSRRAAGNLNGVVDAADEVGAPGGLRIFDAEARQPRARLQVDQKAGGVGGAEIHGKAKQAAFGRRKADDLAPAQAACARSNRACAAHREAGARRQDRRSAHPRPSRA